MLHYHFSLTYGEDGVSIFDRDEFEEKIQKGYSYFGLPYQTSITELLDSIDTTVGTKHTKYLMNSLGDSWRVIDSILIRGEERRTDFSFKTVFAFSDEQELDDFLQFVHKIFKNVYPSAYNDFVRKKVQLLAHPIGSGYYCLEPTHTVTFDGSNEGIIMQLLATHCFKPKKSNTRTVITLTQNKYIDGVLFEVECGSQSLFLGSKDHSMFKKGFQSKEEAREFYDLVKNNLLTIFDRID